MPKAIPPRQPLTDVFAGAVVGLGALGITTAVTFDVVPAFQLHDVTTRASWATALAGLDAALAASDHYKL